MQLRLGLYPVPTFRKLKSKLCRAKKILSKPFLVKTNIKFGFLDPELPISVLVPSIYPVSTNRCPNVPFSEPPCTLFPIPPVLKTMTEKIVTKF